MTYVTAHAALRWIERVNPRLTLAEATAAIHRSDRVIAIAASFGCRVIRLAEKVKLILCGDRVVTVLPCDRPYTGHRFVSAAA